MVAVALTVILLALALEQAALAQDDDARTIPGLLGEAVAHIEQANETNTVLYSVSFAIGVVLASIAICATYKNTSKLNTQLKNYEERTKLLREEIDVDLLPILAWTLAGRKYGEPKLTSAGGRLVIVRIVNAGRAPALRATADVTHRLRLNGGEIFELNVERHSWGAILPNDFVEMPVLVPDRALEEIEGMRGRFRADVLLECRSVTGKLHRRRMAVTCDQGGVGLRDAARDEWRRDIGLDGGDG